MFVKCLKCNSFKKSPAHYCEQHLVTVGDLRYNVWGCFPEHAIENLSKHLDKEIYALIGLDEYYSEKVDGRYNAYLIFEGSNAKR